MILEQQVEFITNNALACIDDLTNDLENLESNKKPKKNQKKVKQNKAKKRRFPESEDEENTESGSSEGKIDNFFREN